MGTYISEQRMQLGQIRELLDARTYLNAQPAGGTPGLWDAPGYPELTTNQLLGIYRATLKARS